MKKRTFELYLSAALIFGLVLAPAASAEDLNRIILRVNEEILTLHEYEGRKATEIQTLLADPRIDANQRQQRLEQIGRLVLQSSFSEMLLLSFAQQHGIRVTDSEVSDAVRGLMERQGIETDAQMQEALRQNNMTVDDVRKNAKRELLWQQVVGREVQPKVKIGEEELRAYYKSHKDEFRTPEQRWLKEVIVLESSGMATAELAKTASEIQQALASGGEFAEVVAPYKEKGITTGVVDLDWLREDELEDSLSAAAWALKPGEYSAPVAARGGFHILHLAGLREAKQMALKEVQDQIMRREYNTRFNREMQQFLARLEDTAYIQENLPPEAVGYRNLTPDFEAEDELELFRAPVLEAPLDDTEPAAEGS